jgi:hypothetical protein
VPSPQMPPPRMRMLATWASSPEKLHDPSRSSSGRDHSQGRYHRCVMNAARRPLGATVEVKCASRVRRRGPLLAISLAVG